VCTKFATSSRGLPTGAFIPPTRRNSTSLLANLFRLVKTVANQLRLPYHHSTVESRRRRRCVLDTTVHPAARNPRRITKTAPRAHPFCSAPSSTFSHRSTPSRLLRYNAAICKSRPTESYRRRSRTRRSYPQALVYRSSSSALSPASCRRRASAETRQLVRWNFRAVDNDKRSSPAAARRPDVQVHGGGGGECCDRRRH